MIRTNVRRLCLAAVAALLFAAPTTTRAGWPYLGYGGGYPWGYNYTYNYGVGYVPPPPYYAVFPPVYYSPHIQARHYGASPFAWYAGMEPITYVAHYAAPPAPAPLMIENPYVAGAAAPPPAPAAAAADRASLDVQPLRIVNPHVAQR
jgi:hypothetical protein